MEVIWTKLAKITYLEVLENLKKHWTKKEIKRFRDLTNDLLFKIKEQQISCPIVNQKLSIKKAVVHENVSLFYKEDFDKNTIYLITFFNNRMDPETLRELLKKYSH